MEQLSYKIDVFEGPMDLLLHLISKHKLNINDIPIVQLVNQYLDYVRQMQEQDFDIAGEFLEMAARLIYIKTVSLLQGDICNIKEFDFLENADVIISNPPYIRQDELANLQSEVKNEPLMALDGGKDGLDFYRVINDNWYSKLNDKGKLFLEIGNEQGESIFNVLYEFENISVIKDLYGNDRIVSANKK